MSAKLTSAQKRVLAAAAKHTFGRVVGGDRSTRKILSDRGYIKIDGYSAALGGPLFKITNAGLQAVASKKG